VTEAGEVEARFREAVARGDWADARRCLPEYGREIEERLCSLPPGEDAAALLGRAVKLLEQARRAAVSERTHAGKELERLAAAASYRRAGDVALRAALEFEG
jgi:hypothetical protein